MNLASFVKIAQTDDVSGMVDMLYEIGRFRLQPRIWEKHIGREMANVAEHTIRVNALSVLLAIQEGADPYKALAISQFHDAGEIRCMDLTPYDKMYVTCNEDQAVKDTFENTPLADFATSLYHEYKERQTLESRCVKDADILDSVLEVHEIAFQGCMFLETSFKETSQKRSAYHTETARQLHDHIMKAGPKGVSRGLIARQSTFSNHTYGK
jgi:putative hydrolase of HD superfamily